MWKVQAIVSESSLIIACRYDCNAYVILFVLWTLQVLIIRNLLRRTAEVLDSECRLSRCMLFTSAVTRSLQPKELRS